jgi:RNA polymerase sigma-70 factor (ECF subfamily)
MNTSTARLQPASLDRKTAASRSSASTASSAQRARRRWLSASPDRVREVTGALFVKYARFITARLRSLGLSPADAEELCAEVFIVAQRKLPGYEGSASLSTWLYGIARKVASDHRRCARSRHETLVGELPEAQSFDSPEDAVEAKLRVQVLRTQIDTLKPAQRSVVLKFSLREQPMEQVARDERVPLHTAYARLYAAHTALGRDLAASLG